MCETDKLPAHPPGAENKPRPPAGLHRHGSEYGCTLFAAFSPDPLFFSLDCIPIIGYNKIWYPDPVL